MPTRGAKFVYLVSHEVIVQTAAADRVRAGPMDFQALVWIRATLSPAARRTANRLAVR